VKRISLVIAIVACAAFVLAQEKTEKEAKPGHAHQQAAKDSAAPAGMEMPKPSPEIERLTKLLVGTW
jgi:hypothetical protein